ncbi:MAG: DUF4097 family beta strand repeat protein [Candidatus Marinimicrobia bacterium]|nr:DUF4097 family beta strand repeat protein [Candidatus Neomarinimicrobiota bacterium]
MWKIKHSILFIVFIGFLSRCERILDCNNCVHNTNFSVEENFSFEIDAEGFSSFEIQGINGNIEISGTSGDSLIHILGTRKVKSDSRADAEEHLDLLEVEWLQWNEKILVRTIQPDETHGRSYEVEYHIKLPYIFYSEILNINGNVSIDSMGNSTDIRLTNGNIEINNLEGAQTVDLTNGNIFIDSHCGSSDINLTNGNIDGESTLSKQGVCKIYVTNGNINLDIPQSTSAEFSAKITNGSISTNNLTFSNFQQSKYSVSGILGNGEGEVDLVTTNGTIRVKGI